MLKRIILIPLAVALSVLMGLIAFVIYEPYRIHNANPLTNEDKLEIYDSFTYLIDRYYYDKSFNGIDWARVRAEGRVAALAQPTVERIYLSVLFPISQKFPTSHVAAIPTDRWSPESRPNKKSSLKSKPVAVGDMAGIEDIGFQAVQIRYPPWDVVGDVEASSPAFRAGIYPGLQILMWKVNIDSDGVGHFSGDFLTSEGKKFSAKYDFKHLSNYKQPSMIIANNKIFIVRFDDFKKNSVDKLLSILDDRISKGVVIDLRRNTGGGFRQLKRVLGRLIPRGISIGRTITAKGVKPIESEGDYNSYKGGIVAIVGPQSASAAEILAEDICEYGRGLTIGRKSNGAVMMAREFRMIDGGHINLPVADYISPRGFHIEGHGVTPDIEVIPSRDDIAHGRDPDVELAVAKLKGSDVGGSGRCAAHSGA
jgi:hypothetical protein